MSLLQALKQILHNSTAVPVHKRIPKPALPAKEELLLWRTHFFEQLKKSAANGQTRFDLVYATTTRKIDDENVSYPILDYSDSMCAISSIISESHVLRADHFCAFPCRGCDTPKPASAFVPRPDFETLFDNDFSFYIPVCKDPTCVKLVKAEATTLILERMRQLGHRSEPTVMVGEESALVSPYCPTPLGGWLVDWFNTDGGFNLESHAQENYAVLYAGSVLQDYLRQLLGPELGACATFCRVRQAGAKDATGVSHYVDHGLFLDWSDDTATGESAGKKSKLGK